MTQSLAKVEKWNGEGWPPIGLKFLIVEMSEIVVDDRFIPAILIFKDEITALLSDPDDKFNRWTVKLNNHRIKIKPFLTEEEIIENDLNYAVSFGCFDDTTPDEIEKMKNHCRALKSMGWLKNPEHNA